MEIRTIKHIIAAICCIVLSHSAYSADELYDSELSGLAYINIPFSGNKGHSSPTFSFTVTQTPTTNITSGIAIDPSIFLINPNRKALFDMQYDLAERHWSRFAFGGINALVYDDVLHANGGGGPVINPKLVLLGIGAGVGLYFLLDDDDDDPHPCTEVLNGRVITLNLHEECEPPPCEQFDFTLNNVEDCEQDI